MVKAKENGIPNVITTDGLWEVYKSNKEGIWMETKDNPLQEDKSSLWTQCSYRKIK